MTEEQLYYEILNMLGLEIIQGRIYDSDAGSFLIYNGGFLYTNDSVIIHKKDTIFNPLYNNKLAEYLLNVLFEKEKQDNGLYVKLFGSNEGQRCGLRTISLSIITNKMNITTGYFYNYCLACIHAMYILADMFVPNLSAFDYTPEMLTTTKKGK